MLREWAESSLRWHYNFEDILGLILVSAVVGAYSLMFAVTRKPRRGWILAACVSFTLMAAMISASPPQSRAGAPAIMESSRSMADTADHSGLSSGGPKGRQP